MTLDSWIVYLVLVIIATSTPGPAVVFIMANSTLHGWRKAIFAAIGNVAGLLCLGVISVSGLGTILKTSQIIFDIIKYSGAAYLIYLGFKMIFQKNYKFDIIKDKLNINNISSQMLFFKAFGVAISNPKAIIFLTALFPQFINTNKFLIPQFIILITVLALFSFTFLMTYALLAYQAKTWLTKPNRITIINRTGGSIFIGFGVLLAISTNKNA